MVGAQAIPFLVATVEGTFDERHGAFHDTDQAVNWSDGGTGRALSRSRVR